jgi:diguanylate cyclase (GGDEF)-like protein
MLQKILVIDDSASIHALLKARLQSEPVELLFTLDGVTGLEKAVSWQPDLILLDIDMPEPNGFEVCKRLKAEPKTTHIPIVFLTGDTSTDQKIRGLELGATDYITKPFEPAELRARIRATLRTKYLMDLLAKKALVDGLTGLWNRVYFESRLNGEMAFSRTNYRTFSCLMIDLDHFKSLNDQCGHMFGDDVLRGVGQVLNDSCRGDDVACRYGGEEFVILACGATSEQAAQLGERIRKRISEHVFEHNGKRIAVTCSIGVADMRNAPPPGVVELADQALYRAKHSGRNRIEVATAGDTASTTAPVRQVA